MTVEVEKPANRCFGGRARGAPLSRRRLLALGGLAAGALLVPGRAWAKKLAVKLDSLPALKQVGGFVIAKLKDLEILFVRDSERSVKAFGPLCTHQRYRLSYDARKKQIVCPNHGSRFDLAGQPLKGPATVRLTPIYPAELDAAKARVVVKVS